MWTVLILTSSLLTSASSVVSSLGPVESSSQLECLLLITSLTSWQTLYFEIVDCNIVLQPPTPQQGTLVSWESGRHHWLHWFLWRRMWSEDSSSCLRCSCLNIPTYLLFTLSYNSYRGREAWWHHTPLVYTRRSSHHSPDLLLSHYKHWYSPVMADCGAGALRRGDSSCWISQLTQCLQFHSIMCLRTGLDVAMQVLSLWAGQAWLTELRGWIWLQWVTINN